MMKVSASIVSREGRYGIKYGVEVTMPQFKWKCPFIGEPWKAPLAPTKVMAWYDRDGLPCLPTRLGWIDNRAPPFWGIKQDAKKLLNLIESMDVEPAMWTQVP